MALPKNNGKREQDISFKAVNNEIGTLKNFFNYLIGLGVIDKNPTDKVRKLNALTRLKTLADEDI